MYAEDDEAFVDAVDKVIDAAALPDHVKKALHIPVM